jgi:hypothetical protein
MDTFNQQGKKIPVVWDFDNLFSLEELLPQYAPDIIHCTKAKATNRTAATDIPAA